MKMTLDTPSCTVKDAQVLPGRVGSRSTPDRQRCCQVVVTGDCHSDLPIQSQDSVWFSKYTLIKLVLMGLLAAMRTQKQYV